MELFVQICDPVRRESEMRKTCKTKINHDCNTPIASSLHFVAICFSETEWQNYCRKHSTYQGGTKFSLQSHIYMVSSHLPVCLPEMSNAQHYSDRNNLWL